MNNILTTQTFEAANKVQLTRTMTDKYMTALVICHQFTKRGLHFPFKWKGTKSHLQLTSTQT